MPLETIASAMPRIMSSLTWQWKAFQEFQPIGGVLASPLSEAFAGSAANSAMRAKHENDRTFFAMRGTACTSTSEICLLAGRRPFYGSRWGCARSFDFGGRIFHVT